MYQGTGLGRGGGGGGHGGGHGGGGRMGGGGGARMGGGGGGRRGFHHGGRGPTNVFVGGGPGWGYGPGWYEPAYVETCAVYDTAGNCICAFLNPDGTCARPVVGFIGGRAVYGLGQEEEKGSSATTWIVGGLLVALAVGAFALEKKGPRPLRGSRA
jgi:hypothetical protein